MASRTPPLQSRSQFHSHWGSFASVGVLPNTIGEVLQADKFVLQAGDLAYVEGAGTFTCVDPGTAGGGDAVWTSDSGILWKWNETDVSQFTGAAIGTVVFGGGGAPTLSFVPAGGTNTGPRIRMTIPAGFNGLSGPTNGFYVFLINTSLPRRYVFDYRVVANGLATANVFFGEGYGCTSNGQYGTYLVNTNTAATRFGSRAEANVTVASVALASRGISLLAGDRVTSVFDLQTLAPGVGGPVWRVQQQVARGGAQASVPSYGDLSTVLAYGSWAGQTPDHVALAFTTNGATGADMTLDFDIMRVLQHPMGP